MNERHFIEVLENAAIVREVHVFGDQLAVGTRADGSGQHMGFGRKMMESMEAIIMEKYQSIQKIAVIS